MEQTDLSECNLCGSTPERWATIALQDRFGLRVHSRLCTACGLVFISPRMTAEDYREFYASGTYRKLTGTENLEESQRNYAEMMVRVLRPTLALSRGRWLLDVGGSTGVTAARLRDEFGVIPWVLDPSMIELQEATKKNLPTLHGTIESLQPDREYEIVTIFQSIDHFLDIKAALKKIHGLLNPTGLLILDICDVLQILDGCKQVEAACKIDHPFGLTFETMRCYLSQAGFEIQHVSRSANGKKVLFVCRKSEQVVAELPVPASIIRFLAVLNRVRLEQFYASLNSQSHREPGSPEAAGSTLPDHGQAARCVVDRIPDGNYD